MTNDLRKVVFHDSPAMTRMGISLVSFIAFIGRSTAISISSAVLLNEVRRFFPSCNLAVDNDEKQLKKQVPKTIPGAPADIVKLVESSVDAVRTLPPQYKQGAILAYAHSLRLSLIVGIPFGKSIRFVAGSRATC
jgi:hypothetical protein